MPEVGLAAQFRASGGSANWSGSQHGYSVPSSCVSVHGCCTAQTPCRGGRARRALMSFGAGVTSSTALSQPRTGLHSHRVDVCAGGSCDRDHWVHHRIHVPDRVLGVVVAAFVCPGRSGLLRRLRVVRALVPGANPSSSSQSGSCTPSGDCLSKTTGDLAVAVFIVTSEIIGVLALTAAALLNVAVLRNLTARRRARMQPARRASR